jgi:hypothetical protein
MTKIFFFLSRHFLSPGASGGSWTQTLDLKMMRQVFYHCTTTTGHQTLDKKGKI